jgi:hypothetical protein
MKITLILELPQMILGHAHVIPNMQPVLQLGPALFFVMRIG